uniref:Ste-b n=1 Tax=Brassica napus TaxID=3708 RepID=B5ANZ1_BRANA|nr:Ste-b [Brassica napus]
MVDLLNSVMNLVAPPATMVVMAFSWPLLCFITFSERLYNSYFVTEDMEDKVVVITGASSAIGEQIAYEYAKRGANLVLVARREQRLRVVSNNARQIGANHVIIIAADVVKEDDCRRFITQAVNYYGRVDHLVNSASLGHTFYFDEVSDTTVFPHLLDINFWGNVYPTYVALPHLQKTQWPDRCERIGRELAASTGDESLFAAKAALVNFYETLRFELNGDVGITIATHGWIGSEMSRGKFMLEEGAEMQWKEEREVPANGGPLEDFAKMIVAGACRGDAYVKFPNWYDVFLLYRVFTPNVLRWTFKPLLSSEGSRQSSLVGVGQGVLVEESSSQMKLMLEGGSPRVSASPPHYTASPTRVSASPPHYTASPPRYTPSPSPPHHTSSPQRYTPSPSPPHHTSSCHRYTPSPSPPRYTESPPLYTESPPHYTTSPNWYAESPPRYTPSPSPPRFSRFNIQELP